MTRTLSVRLPERTRAKVALLARREGLKPHAWLVRAIEEATRTAAHPLVRFEDRGEGRRAVMEGWEVWEVIVAFLYAQEDLSIAAGELGVGVATVEAAVAYYGECSEEIDELLTAALAERDARARSEARGEFSDGVAALKNAPGRS